MNMRNLLWCCLFAGFGLLIYYGFHALFVFKDVEKPVPLAPGLELHPFLAAENFLKKQNLRVHSEPRLMPESTFPPPEAVLVLNGDRHDFDRSQMAELFQWADSGGHLIAFLRSGQGSDFLLEKLGLSMVDFNDEDKPQSEVIEIKLKRKTYDLELLDAKRMIAYDETEGVMTQDNNGGICAIQVEYGDGLITLLSDSAFMTNEYLEGWDHAALLLGLVTLHRPDPEIWLVYADDYPSLATLIWEHASVVVLSLLGLLLLLLWQKMPRLGPIRPDPPPERRRLLEHIEASGRFFWVNRMALPLFQATRQNMLDHLRRKKPDWANLPNEEFIQRLVAHSGMPEEAIGQVLHLGIIDRPETFFKLILWTETLRRSL